MDITEVANLVSSLGFPIFACISIFIMLNKEREDHKQEINDLKNVITTFNGTIESLKQLIQDKL